MDTRAELAQTVTDILSDDPRRAVAAYRRLVQAELPWLERRVVELARKDHWSWARIGRGLGLSRQRVHEKYAKPKLVLRPDPHAEATRREREWRSVRRLREFDRDDVVGW